VAEFLVEARVLRPEVLAEPFLRAFRKVRAVRRVSPAVEGIHHVADVVKSSVVIGLVIAQVT
jgi:hypothetical protein